MQKTEIPGIYKESEGILINKDNEALLKYKKKRDLFWQKDERINSMENKINNLSNDIEEIKEMLKKALTNVNC